MLQSRELYSIVVLAITAIIHVSVCTHKLKRNADELDKHPNWKILSSLEDGCGLSEADRIIGGVDAALGEFPWIARLGYISLHGDPNEQIDYKCGGTLISPLYVVTAAHCVKVDEIKLVQVRLGEHDTSTDIDCAPNGVCSAAPQDRGVASTVIHESYNQPYLSHDLALIRLDKPVNITDWVAPICLPRGLLRDNIIQGKGEVAGWGSVDMNYDEPATVLQKLHIPLLSLDHCKTFYRKYLQLSEEQMCAGGEVHEDSCGGDSGGPLMKVAASDVGPRYYLLGTVSFGPADCGSDIPAIYGNIIHHTSWILDHIQP